MAELAQVDRAWGVARALAGVGRALPLIVPWLLLNPAGARARRLERRFHRTLARAFGLHIEAVGRPAPAAGTLYVANHVSWADIVALGSLLDAQFVARHDIARWPLLGALARRKGIIFVDRAQRGRVDGQADAVRACLAAGQGVILFPEGTTSDGRAVARFRTSLFEAALGAERIQPVAIVYGARDGRPLADAPLAKLAWTDEEPFGANARGFARTGATATVHFLDRIPVTATLDRKQAAAWSHAAIEGAYRSARTPCDAAPPEQAGAH